MQQSDDYNSAVLHGIVKIASKMGISTIQSYQGSQIFEAIGISKDVIDKYFTNTVSRIGGIDIRRYRKAMWIHCIHVHLIRLDLDTDTDSGQHRSAHKMRSGKEEHLYNPQTIHLASGVYKNAEIMRLFKEYTHIVNEEETP